MYFFIKTLGCKMNWLDSARLRSALELSGHREVLRENEADYVFINTCTVTAEADRKSHQAANLAGRLAVPVAVMGCSPRVDAGKWEEAGRLVFNDEQVLYEHFDIDPETLPVPIGARTRLPIAIQRGCDNHCAFCITRIARGSHQSVPIDDVVAQIHAAEEIGIQEVVLTGINLAAWGCFDSNRPEQARLGEMLEAVLRQTGIKRIRLSSLGPEYLNSGLLDAISDERICDYFHLSVQSGCETVLRRMARGHGTEEVVRFAERARRVRPDLALATDLIAGFPGESTSEHSEGLSLIETLRFAKLHVFPYSERDGTPAIGHPDPIPVELRKERAAELRQLGKRLRRTFIDSQLGKSSTVLVERGETGLTPNYIRLNCSGHTQGELLDLHIGTDNLAE